MVTGITTACDLAVSSDKARFGVTETNVGLWPMTIQATMLRSLGRKRLLYLLMTGDTIEAWEAERLGIVNKVVPDGQIEDAWMELASKLARKSPPSMKIGKDSYYAMEDMDWSQSQAFLRECQVTLLGTEDAQEGLQAFLDKRRPAVEGPVGAVAIFGTEKTVWHQIVRPQKAEYSDIGSLVWRRYVWEWDWGTSHYLGVTVATGPKSGFTG